MSNLNQFFGSYQVGQTAYFISTPTSGDWLPCDGAEITRSSYPMLSALLPVGVFTSTARTLAATPGEIAIAADSTNFLAPAATGTDALQSSADGITWVATTGGWAASTSFPSMIVSGTRWVIAPSAGESQPYVKNIGATAAQNVVKANWTATTGGTVTTLKKGLAYDSVNGKTVLCKNGSLATASALFYLNDGATAWSAASGGSTLDRSCVVFTGQNILAFPAATGNIYQLSSNGGVTYSDAYFKFTQTNGINMAASDGNGTVVFGAGGISSGTVKGGRCLVVSKDHGVTWKLINTSSFDAYLYGSNVCYISYVSGKFICGQSVAAGSLISVDGENWYYEPISHSGVVPLERSLVFAYKNGVYCAFGNASTCLTATESATKFRVPTDGLVYVDVTGKVYTPIGKLFIKAR